MKPVKEAPTEAAEAPKPEEEVPQAPTETPQAEEPIAPHFTTLLQPRNVHDGDRVELTVRFIGRPSPRITWYQNGVELKPNPDFEIYVDHTKGESTLIIVEVFPEDEGEYTCIAINEVGESITTCKITVVSKCLALTKIVSLDGSTTAVICFFLSASVYDSYISRQWVQNI